MPREQTGRCPFSVQSLSRPILLLLALTALAAAAPWWRAGRPAIAADQSASTGGGGEEAGDTALQDPSDKAGRDDRSSEPLAGSSVDNVVRIAWDERPPYAMAIPSLHSRSHERVVGIDISIVREALILAGYRPNFVRSDSWQQSLQHLEQGEVDAVLGAFLSDERLAFSMPGTSYRDEKLSLFVHERSGDAAAIDSVVELKRRLDEGLIRLGIPRDYYFGRTFPEMAGSHQSLIREAGSELALADATSAGRIDGFVADWMSGHDAIRRQDSPNSISPTPLVIYDAPVHTLFRLSPRTPLLIAAYDAAIESMVASGRIGEIEREYAIPSLVEIALSGRWFDLLDAIGTVAFALSGVLIARAERFSIFGAIILAGLPAVGGGALRDLLVARHPLGIFVSEQTIWLLLATVAASYLIGIVYDLAMRRRGVTQRATGPARGITLIDVTDAIGLAAFTITGVYIAMRFRMEPLIVWGPFLAFLTAAGGGVLRDVIREGRGQPTLTRSLYAELSILGAAVFVLWANLLSPKDVDAGPVLWTVVLVMVVIFAARMLVVARGISSPKFSPFRSVPETGSAAAA